MRFTKMQGCGNDYVYVNLWEEAVGDPAETARRVSDRHFGIGADGLITIGPSSRADFRMRIYNADGSEAEMCGNGIRCVAKYAYDHGMTDRTRISVETGAGIKELELSVADSKVERVRVDMGEPVTLARQIPVSLPQERVVDVPIEAGGRTFRITCVSMGNPHAVVFVPRVSDFPVERFGPILERHPIFPNRTNVEFVEVLGKGEVRMRVWERGSAETMACGTGACASVVAAILNGLVGDKVLVHLLGGDLAIDYDRERGRVFMTGPAVTVFEGEI